MSYSHLATEAMRRAAAAVERQKAETTCRLLDEIGITFDWGASSYSSSAAAPNPSSSSHIDPNDSRIPPESSDDEEMMNEQEGESVGDEQMIAGNHVADDQKFVSIFNLFFYHHISLNEQLNF